MQLISTVLLNGPLESHECNVLVLLDLPLLLLFLSTLSYGVMLTVPNSGVDHLVIELVGVSLARLLAELLDHILLGVIVLRATFVVTFLLQEAKVIARLKLVTLAIHTPRDGVAPSRRGRHFKCS